MSEERKWNKIIYSYCKKPNYFDLLRKNQAEENGNGTRNGVVGTVTEISLSSSHSEKEIDHEI
jgi:hypothetical protein